MNVISLREAQARLSDLVHRTRLDADATVIAGEGDDKAVLISLEEFNAWQETLHLLSTPANAEHLQKSIAEAETGRVAEHKLIDP